MSGDGVEQSDIALYTTHVYFEWTFPPSPRLPSAFDLPCPLPVLLRLQLSVLVLTARVVAHSCRHLRGTNLARSPDKPRLFPTVRLRSLS